MGKEEGKEQRKSDTGDGRFSTVQRVMLVVAALWFAWIARDLILLLFTGVLLALFLRTLAVVVAERTRMTTGWSLLVVVLVLLSMAVGAGWLFAPRLADQVRELSDTLPNAASRLLDQVRQTSFGGWALEQIQGGTGSAPEEKIVEQATNVAWKIVHFVVAIAIVLFTGGYLASSPAPYVRGVLRLLPMAHRRRSAEAIFAAGYTLRWWILGQLLAMTLVGVAMGVGLALIGVPMAFALGVLAGLFEFIPTIGPIFGLLPALLLALAEEPQMALWVLVLYGVVQTMESYLVTPLVQQRVLHLPPVVTIATQVLFAWTLGPLGLLVAVPVVGVLMVIIQMLYVKDFLGDRMPLKAEKEARRELEESEFVEGLI